MAHVRAGLATAAVLSAALACNATNPSTGPSPAALAFLDTVQTRTFEFFWELTNPRNGLTPDRWPTRSFSSIAAVGFALTA